MSNLLHSSLAGVKAFACAFYLPQQTAHKSNSGQNHFVAEPNVLWLFLILLTLSIHYPCPSTYLPTYLPTQYSPIALLTFSTHLSYDSNPLL
jgi:hypothetical protein